MYNLSSKIYNFYVLSEICPHALLTCWWQISCMVFACFVCVLKLNNLQNPNSPSFRQMASNLSIICCWRCLEGKSGEMLPDSEAGNARNGILIITNFWLIKIRQLWMIRITHPWMIKITHFWIIKITLLLSLVESLVLSTNQKFSGVRNRAEIYKWQF